MTYPIPELTELIYLVINDATAYKTTIVNTENAVMVTDAPPHQSKLVIEWVRKNLKKKVTHLLVSLPNAKQIINNQSQTLTQTQST